MDQQNEALEIVRDIIHGQAYRVPNQQSHDGLNRLITYPEAVIAWTRIYEKQPKNPDDYFYSAAVFIVNDATAAWHSESFKKTTKQIQAAAKKAAELAMDLAKLIEDNGSLQSIGLIDICADYIQVSLDRVLTGIMHGQGIKNRLQFSPEVEAGLSAFPVTTSEAYRNLRYWLGNDALIDALKTFEVQAKSTETRYPLSDRPNADNFNQNRLCVGICSALNYVYGQPFTEIAAALTGVVFDEQIDNETAKKWWQRDQAKEKGRFYTE